jgi:transcriptional regulator with XRE-family HTH domain
MTNSHQPEDRSDLVVSIQPRRLAAACAARGWSYEELARRARLSRPTVSAARRGASIRPMTAYKILRAFQEAPAPAEAAELLEQL